MKKIFSRAGLVLVCGLAASTQANYDITLEDSNLSLNVNGQSCQLVSGESGQPIDSITVNRSGTSATVSVTTAGAAQLSCMEYVPGQPVSSSSSSSSSVSSNSSSSSSGGGTPAPGVDLSACGGEWPSSIIQGGELNLAGMNQATQPLQGNRTISFPIKTTAAGNFSMFNVAGYSDGLGVGRQAWISTCPGGQALPSRRCTISGSEAFSLRIAQGSGSASYCVLEVGKQYFINVENTTCTSSTRNCGFYRSIL